MLGIVFYSDQSEVHNSLNLNPYDLTNPRLQPKKNSSSVPSSNSFSKSCETYFYKWTRNKITSVSGASEDYDRALKENHLTHEDATKLGPAPLSVKLKRWRMGKMKLYSDLPRTTEGFKNKLDLAK
ncbi:uncharacterized protein LOC136027003 isoform X2 [Artemia franciscana]|uniref:uncharacterized protein LOC136027003 isoform X2 n=1 Tax=Artemia franciscana TaxID=6661 RepID=UPI0032DAE185